VPTKCVGAPAEVAYRIGGLTIYHAYGDDDYDQGRERYDFVMKPDGLLEDSFDVRKLPTWKEPAHPPYIDISVDSKEVQTQKTAAWDVFHKRTEPRAIRAAIAAAIAQGIVTSEGVKLPTPPPPA
jgi:hypothetical protein